jgi:hypothetical protein
VLAVSRSGKEVSSEGGVGGKRKYMVGGGGHVCGGTVP